MARVSIVGYGQVEPNHLSAQKTGEILAQLPFYSATATDVLENGMFAKYDAANSKVQLSGNGEWMLHFSEVKVYGERETDANFAIKVGEYPRLFKTNVGDIFTTNVYDLNSQGDAGAGDLFIISSGVLTKQASTATIGTGAETDIAVGTIVFEAVKVTTLPDGKAAVKFIRVQ